MSEPPCSGIGSWSNCLTHTSPNRVCLQQNHGNRTHARTLRPTDQGRFRSPCQSEMEWPRHSTYSFLPALLHKQVRQLDKGAPQCCYFPCVSSLTLLLPFLSPPHFEAMLFLAAILNYHSFGLESPLCFPAESVKTDNWLLFKYYNLCLRGECKQKEQEWVHNSHFHLTANPGKHQFTLSADFTIRFEKPTVNK